VATVTHPGTSALARAAIIGGVAAALVGCDDLTGFGAAAPPLATVRVEVTGDFASVQAPHAENPSLRVALAWGAQWLTEPLCILPTDDASVAALVAAGCRDPFGFVPDRVAANAPLEADGTATLTLLDLPAADVMVGDVTARVAYGSVIVYDDRDGDGTLHLGRPSRLGGRDDVFGDGGSATADLVYGASFVSMTEPDTRLAFREGGFNASAAFYPRRGCGDPPAGFSLVSAGGFPAAEALATALRGELPAEDPATCRESSTDMAVSIAFRSPAQLHELACTERRTDSSIRYLEPPADPLDFRDRRYACAKVADFGSGQANGMIQLVVSGLLLAEQCVGITHYVLRGCRNDALCELPQWDITATPPSWWPCPVAAPP
jgi:hypothetical protein